MTYEYIPIPSERLLSIDPAPFGFGYAVLEYEPAQLIDWATKWCRRNDGTALAAVEQLVVEYQPTAIVLPSWREVNHPFRGPALESFIEAVGEALNSPALPVLMCTPDELRAHFEHVAAPTKQARAEYLAQKFPALRSLLPARRTYPQREPKSLTVFEAVAMALTVSGSKLG